jgi:predicted AlkP superfamily phosphohydrolase/phosphomutase
MPAFVIPGFSDAQIRINLAGRERDGIVDRDDYDRACDDVERVLRACRDGATGASVVREVHRVRADDPFAPDGPPADLIVQLEGADAIEHPELGPVGPVVASRTGGHTTNGFAFVAGRGITPGPRGEFAVCDLSATITALVGAPSLVPLDGTAFVGDGTPR